MLTTRQERLAARTASLRSISHQKGTLRVSLAEMRNLARRAGYDLSRHRETWSVSGPFWVLRFRGRDGRRAFGHRYGRRAGLDFCATQFHTATERAFVWLQGIINRTN